MIKTFQDSFMKLKYLDKRSCSPCGPWTLAEGVKFVWLRPGGAFAAETYMGLFEVGVACSRAGGRMQRDVNPVTQSTSLKLLRRSLPKASS